MTFKSATKEKFQHAKEAFSNIKFGTKEQRSEFYSKALSGSKKLANKGAMAVAGISALYYGGSSIYHMYKLDQTFLQAQKSASKDSFSELNWIASAISNNPYLAVGGVVLYRQANKMSKWFSERKTAAKNETKGEKLLYYASCAMGVPKAAVNISMRNAFPSSILLYSTGIISKTKADSLQVAAESLKAAFDSANQAAWKIVGELGVWIYEHPVALTLIILGYSGLNYAKKKFDIWADKQREKQSI